MTTHYHPFFDAEDFAEEDLQDPTNLAALLLTTTAPYFHEMHQDHRKWSALHLRCHLIGLDSGPEHDQTLERIDAIEADVRRAVAAVWS